MKNILIPVDFSNYSLSAAKTAVAIAKKSGSNLHLLHIADIPVGWSKQPVTQMQNYPQLESRLVEAEMRLEKFSKLPIFKDHRPAIHVEGGVPFEQINIFARRDKITLIVMGVHGAGDSDLKFIGSTAQRVIRTAPCPVLGVKRSFNFGNIKKILFASDFEENVSTPVSIVKNLAEDFAANIDLAYINTPGHFVDDVTTETRMKQFIISQKRVKFHTVIQNSPEKEQGILDCAKRRNADLIAMVTHLRKQKPSYLVSVTESVIFHSKLPVLSFVIDEARHLIK
ncbi:MAG: universal stress protein [Cyclobacteriaceae bacterium]|nr:universal stress protein [Cyclobacteriaceae bacterium]